MKLLLTNIIKCPYYCWLFRVDTSLIIKIADFGLAKDVYTTEYYRAENILHCQ